MMLIDWLLTDWIGATLLVIGCGFFLAGTIGLLRFPDVYSRLHALAKADNLGLGCILLGLAQQADHLALALKLLLIWPLVLGASGRGRICHRPPRPAPGHPSLALRR